MRRSSDVADRPRGHFVLTCEFYYKFIQGYTTVDSDRGINHRGRQDEYPEFGVANANANYPSAFVMFHNFNHQNLPTKPHIHQSKKMYYNTK